MERQPETVIWPVAALVYLIVLIVFLVIVVHRGYYDIQNSKTRFRGTTHIRHIDVCLVVIVIMKLAASVLQTAVIWITLNSSNVHIF